MRRVLALMLQLSRSSPAYPSHGDLLPSQLQES